MHHQNKPSFSSSTSPTSLAFTPTPSCMNGDFGVIVLFSDDKTPSFECTWVYVRTCVGRFRPIVNGKKYLQYTRDVQREWSASSSVVFFYRQNKLTFDSVPPFLPEYALFRRKVQFLMHQLDINSDLAIVHGITTSEHATCKHALTQTRFLQTTPLDIINVNCVCTVDFVISGA